MKDPDRIGSLASELRKLGVQIEERPDGFVIAGPTRLHGATVDSHGDHRLAMSLAVAGLMAKGETTVTRAEAYRESFPNFVELMNGLGGTLPIARISRMMDSTKTVGLIGWPVERSRSPAMHNAAFAALGLAWRYILLPTPLDQLAAVIARIRSGELQGANVTIPHKQAVMAYLDEIDPAARAVGAVDTIVKQEERLIGFNTDTFGFKRSLIETGVEVADQPCAILGAGGSARAVVYVLQELGAHITMYARDVRGACRSRELPIIEHIA